MNLQFTVYGRPAPQGSMKALMRKGARFPVVISDNAKTMPWRQQVAGMCMAAMNGNSDLSNQVKVERSGAIEVAAKFYFSRPKSAKRAAYKTTKPDTDKLARSVLDALTGIAFEDDSQVTRLNAEKAFGDPPRAEISILEL